MSIDVNMYDLDIPNGVEAGIEGGTLSLKGKFGSAVKKANTRLFTLRIEQRKITIEITKNKKLLRKAELAVQAFSSEVRGALDGVQNGIEKKMVVFFAHFPMTIEIKGRTVSIKNIFGEKIPRVTQIVGDTKVEVKGQEVIVKGVDPYDVGQTVANLRKLCYARGHDTRVFQDGLYISRAE